MDALIVFVAKYLPYLMIVAILFWLFNRETRKRLFIFMELTIAAIISRGLITEWIRFAYYHPRPFEALGIQNLIPESGASFPSGHMTFYFALGMILFYYSKKFGGWFMGLTFVVGVARIMAGVHWPLDILGGMIIGVLSAAAVHYALKKYWLQLDAKPKVVGVEKIDIIEIQKP